MKVPLDIDVVMRRVEEAVRPFPKAALFQLAEDGYGSPFEQLVACMISIRTRDEATIVIARNLFSHARTPAEFADLSPEVIDEWIHQSSFHENKAVQIRDIARRVLSEYDGQLPCDEALLLSLPGIGPKCARLVLGIACGMPLISVDVHVDRVTNRWGYVRAPRPEATMVALEAVLPQRYWLDINRLLVPFGKHICTGRLPRCSTCPVLEMCRQVGVTSHR